MKAALFLPTIKPDTAGFFVLLSIAIAIVLYAILVLSKRRAKIVQRTFWAAGIVGLLIGLDFNNPLVLSFISTLFLTSILGLRIGKPDRKTTRRGFSTMPGLVAETVQEENTILRRRIQSQTQSFFLHATFLESLLTLNEIQMFQGVVESATHLLSADQVSLYQIKKGSDSFYLTSRFHRRSGLKLRPQPAGDDRILNQCIKQRKPVSILQIGRDKDLLSNWQGAGSRAMIYCPIYHENLFIGVLTVDEIEFHHLNRETVRNLQTIASLTGLAYRNIRAHETLLTNREEQETDRFSSYLQFLKSLNTEFKRAKRNQVPLSLLSLSVETGLRDDHHEQAPAALAETIKQGCRSNLREVDMMYQGEQPGQLWIILPFTDFDGLSHVMERLNIITREDLSSHADYSCHMGFSSIYDGIKQPKQMIDACLESLLLHRTVCELVTRREIKTGILSE